VDRDCKNSRMIFLGFLVLTHLVEKPTVGGGIQCWTIRQGKNRSAWCYWDIFNSSFESGQVPEDWKVTNVTTLFKKRSREELQNCTSVSLTSFVGKVLAKLIKEWIRNHLTSGHGWTQTFGSGLRSHGFTGSWGVALPVPVWEDEGPSLQVLGGSSLALWM